MGNILNWARREVELACKRERNGAKEEGFDYGCACYRSALKALESLAEDGHSGYSIVVTQNILNRLIEYKPLTPIEDTDDIWNLCNTDKDGTKMYQCSRMSSLFKYAYADGSVKYSDIDSYICVDVNNKNTYRSGLVRIIMEEMSPITMPYMPGKPIMVYCEEFLTDVKNGDFDTVGVFYALKEENGEQNRIEINRFFREPIGDESGTWTEISQEEYELRRDIRINQENCKLKGGN